MLTGRVKNWTERGFGFATPEDGGQDVFVHVSQLPPGFTSLIAGQRIEFLLETNPANGKTRATDVRVVS
jgi:cold shock protein